MIGLFFQTQYNLVGDIDMNISKQIFNDFEVYSSDECNTFFHINITNPNIFYSEMFEYFFDENRLLRYIENKASISFEPTMANYAALYKKLKIFIDKENDIDYPQNIDSEISNILIDEHTIIEENGVKKIRLDKMGKIGEYIFSNILSEYFGYQCIIPKLNMLTDYNMSIFGIDTLFYSHENKLLLLGESKVSKSIKNGIALINKSLSSYQSQVDDEFELVLSQRWLKDKMGYFNEDFGDKVEVSINMADFIKKASVEKICIPIFIAHGGNESVEEILKKLSKIPKIKLYDIDTSFITISLPLIDKTKFMNAFTVAIAQRRDLYESNIQ